MIIIPAVDIKNGRCVRLRQGRKHEETVFSDDPAKMAMKFDKDGAELIHVIDLDGAFKKSPQNLNSIKKIIESVKAGVQVGQEWARSKVIAETSVFDNNIGQIDHNSYNKDNETNWLNWDEKEMNLDLVDYYKGLIQLRKKYPEFRHSEPEDFEFLDVGEQVALAYILQNKFIVALNGDSENNLEFDF